MKANKNTYDKKKTTTICPPKHQFSFETVLSPPRPRIWGLRPTVFQPVCWSPPGSSILGAQGSRHILEHASSVSTGSQNKLHVFPHMPPSLFIHVLSEPARADFFLRQPAIVYFKNEFGVLLRSIAKCKCVPSAAIKFSTCFEEPSGA